MALASFAALSSVRFSFSTFCLSESVRRVQLLNRGNEREKEGSKMVPRLGSGIKVPWRKGAVSHNLEWICNRSGKKSGLVGDGVVGRRRLARGGAERRGNFIPLDRDWVNPPDQNSKQSRDDDDMTSTRRSRRPEFVLTLSMQYGELRKVKND